MEALTVREYRNNLAASFDRAAEGERVLIRRKNTIYALVSVGVEESTLSPSQQQMVQNITDSIKRSWEEVKRTEAGEIQAKSAISFLDEL